MALLFVRIMLLYLRLMTCNKLTHPLPNSYLVLFELSSLATKEPYEFGLGIGSVLFLRG